MPRKPRLIFPGAVYHITVRGNNQQKIFKSLADYLKYIRILREAKKLFHFKLYAFVLMPNHIHLFIAPSEIASISQIMQKINLNYTKYFNHKHKCSGHLFQGRFYSSLITNESYFWVVSRYIHLNPVRAKLCQQPADYRWSSYSAYCQIEYKDDLVDRDELLNFLSANLSLEQKIIEYKKFVEEGIGLKEDYFESLVKELKLVD
jgi:REP element-mobilizing transposase RayT